MGEDSGGREDLLCGKPSQHRPPPRPKPSRAQAQRNQRHCVGRCRFCPALPFPKPPSLSGRGEAMQGGAALPTAAPPRLPSEEEGGAVGGGPRPSGDLGEHSSPGSSSARKHQEGLWLPPHQTLGLRAQTQRRSRTLRLPQTLLRPSGGGGSPWHSSATLMVPDLPLAPNTARLLLPSLTARGPDGPEPLWEEGLG